MKFTCIFALALVGFMLALSMVSCGGDSSDVTKVKLKMTVLPEDDPTTTTDIFADGTIELAIPGKDPTVIDVLKIAEEEYEVEFEIEESDSENGRSSLKAVNDYNTYTDEETGYRYAWYFLINGEEANYHAGKATVAEGDTIEYIYEVVIPEE